MYTILFSSEPNMGRNATSNIHLPSKFSNPETKSPNNPKVTNDNQSSMAFSLSSLSKSLSSLLPSQSPTNSPSFLSPATNLQLPKNPSGFAPLVSTWDPKPTSTCLSSTLTTADDITAITCPSLAYANTMFFKSGCYNVQVVVAENEPEEKLLARFRRAVFKAGVIQECKRRRFFETSQEKKKRKVKEASKRNRKRRPLPKVSLQAKEETPKKKDDDEDDNWELPEGDLPY
ncbi:hypothetical protein REPUB_Repub07fG0030700 [Reevesia pubescens]